MKRQRTHIYSFGYWGCGGNAHALKRRLLAFNHATRGRGLFWVDLRIRRSVRARDFIGDRPRHIFGLRNYEWIPDFGNEDILAGNDGITVRNYEAGFAALLKVINQARSARQDIILFCACPLATGCHRTNVMRWLRRKLKLTRNTTAVVVGEFPATRFANYFDRPEQEAACNRWRRSNPRGFLLNCSPDWQFKLHRANCHHFGSTRRTIGQDNWSITKIPKKCHCNEAALTRWAVNLGAKVTKCTTCLP